MPTLLRFSATPAAVAPKMSATEVIFVSQACNGVVTLPSARTYLEV